METTMTPTNFGIVLDKSDRLLKERLRFASAVSARLNPGRWHWFFVVVDERRRLFGLYCPNNWDASRRTPVWIAADGVTLFRREGNMAEVNGLEAAAEANGCLLAVLY